MLWGDEAAERHEMDQPMDPLREDGSPRLPTGERDCGAVL